MTGADSIIAELLAGRWRDPETGTAVSVPIRQIAIAPSLAGSEAELVKPLGLGRRLSLVSDPITQERLGTRVERALASIAAVERVALPDRPHADDATVERVRQATAGADALIAVGSGTINDLCKYAAFLDGKPYAVFGTAPSMNGYCSANAAITVGGLKKSLPARVPAGVFLDLGILAAAPPRMIRSGLGDSLCRPTAQFDWLLSHLLLGTPYRLAPFALLAADEGALLEEAGALVAGDAAAMARLARTLVLSGLGMVICDGSYPASQGEHLVSHYVEMMEGGRLPESFHGEQIGVTTLSLARLQQRLIEGPPPLLRATAIAPGDLKRHFGAGRGEACRKEWAGKALDAPRAELLTARLAQDWGRLRTRLAAVMRPVALLERALEATGAPRRASELGWPGALYRTALIRARQTRNRYTALDLAGDAGLLEGFAIEEAG
ncbi:3-dehydroquinate synthase [Hypericibacter adhaerens]|uniref:3-dehydroquinate synthase n=1 Tax=Hypericibacter adhaerens TaxID=2602016 RepID=A0A5J6N4M0_9PROT|nr:iron-containing alcohol dehydrogenase [Hypericibacter adhaerens]QEX24878.1 3-dehydroquinate synthase [Hypericibacter adhaerens]